MWSKTLSLAAKAKREGRKDEARALFLLAALEAKSEGLQFVPLRLEQCAEECH